MEIIYPWIAFKATEILSLLNGRRQRDFFSDYLRAMRVWVCAGVCVLYTPGSLEDISHFFYTVVIFCSALSSSSSLHLICKISLHPSLTVVTRGESLHPQLWSEGWGTFFKSWPAKLFVCFYEYEWACLLVCICILVNSSMDVYVWMCVCTHVLSHFLSTFACDACMVRLITFTPNTGEMEA